MGKLSRDKGRRFELFVEKVIKVCFPDAHVMGGSQSRDRRYADVEGTPFRIEAKHWASLSYGKLQKFMKKAEAEGAEFDDNRIPILVAKVDHQREPFVIFTLHNFLRMVEERFWSPPEEADVIPIRPPVPEEPATPPEEAS